MNLEGEVLRIRDRLIDSAASASPPRKVRKIKQTTRKSSGKAQMKTAMLEEAPTEQPGEKRKRPGKKQIRMSDGPGKCN
jgi:hypothetical protein